MTDPLKPICEEEKISEESVKACVTMLTEIEIRKPEADTAGG